LLAIGGVGVLFPRGGKTGESGQVRSAAGFAGPSIVMPSDGSSPTAAVDPTRLVPYLAAAGPGVTSAATQTSTPEPTPTSGTTPSSGTTPTPVAVARRFSSCHALNAVYPHGVGLPKATDHKAHGKPVTNFGRSTSIYGANHKQDTDHDGIACEHH
jgi:hypothetical protein